MTTTISDTQRADAVDVILRDGSTLRLARRSPRTRTRSSPSSRGCPSRACYLRFHGIQRIGAELVAHFLDPDWDEQGALVGTLADDGGERVVALANYARLRDRHGRGGVRGRGRVPAAAASAPGCSSSSPGAPARRDRALRRRRAAAEPPDARGVRERGFDVTRELAQGEIDVRSRSQPTGRVPERVESATTSRGRLAAAVLRTPLVAVSAPRGAPARSAASSSATSSRGDFAAPRTPSTEGRAGRRRPRATRRSRTSRTTSTSPSSASPASR